MMSRFWLTGVLVVSLITAGPSSAFGQALVGQRTMAEWYALSKEAKVFWLSGAMGALQVLGVRCSAPPTVGSVEDAMTLRYLGGAWKGTDRAIGGLIVVMADHGCVFESEEILTAINVILRSLKDVR